MTKKTLKEIHIEFGYQFRIIRSALLKCEVINANNKITTKLTQPKFKKLCIDFELLRNDLDEEFCQLDDPKTINSPYYGGVEE